MPSDPFSELPPVQSVANRVIVGTALLIGALAAVGLLFTSLGPLESLRRWDERVSASLADSRSDQAIEWAERITTTGDTLSIVAVLAVITSLLALTRHWRAMWFVPLAMAVELTTFLTVNSIVGRPRPSVAKIGPVPGTFSFPSGHVAATLVCWIGAALLLGATGRTVAARVVAARILAALGALMTVAMGWARVYLGMHHSIDVVLGVVMGAGALIVAARALGPRNRRTTEADRLTDDPVASGQSALITDFGARQSGDMLFDRRRHLYLNRRDVPIRWLSAAAVAVIASSTLAGCGSADGAGAGPIVEIELGAYVITPNELTVPSGAMQLRVTNVDNMIHNLVVAGWGTRPLNPGETQTVPVDIDAGEYAMWCDIPGHRELGQTGVLRSTNLPVTVASAVTTAG